MDDVFVKIERSVCFAQTIMHFLGTLSRYYEWSSAVVWVAALWCWSGLSFNLQSVKEEVFWRNYFYRVSLIKQSAQLTALAAQQQAAEKRQEEKTEDATDGDMPGIGIKSKLLIDKLWQFKLCCTVAHLDGACLISLCRNHQTENPSHYHQRQAKVKWGRTGTRRPCLCAQLQNGFMSCSLLTLCHFATGWRGNHFH